MDCFNKEICEQSIFMILSPISAGKKSIPTTDIFAKGDTWILVENSQLKAENLSAKEPSSIKAAKIGSSFEACVK